MTNSILLNIKDNIAEVILNKPERHNAFDEDLLEEFLNIILDLKKNSKIKIVLFKANGPTFCAGADLRWMQKMQSFTEKENYKDASKLAKLFYEIYSLPQVTIAVVTGPAYGGGVGIVACCDLVVAINTAEFCFTEVKLGLIPAVISPYVIKAIGHKATKHYFITAQKISADRAYQLGLVDYVIDDAVLDSYLQNLIKQLVNNSIEAMSKVKTFLDAMSEMPIDKELIDYTAKTIAAIRVSDDAQGRLKKFINKRNN